MNGTMELIRNRMSLRKYKEENISKEHLDLILEGIMRAPTAGNMMMYSVIVVKDEEKKKKLSESCDNQPFIAKAPVVLIFLADMQRWYDYFEHCDVQDYCIEKGLKYDGPDEASLLLAANDAIIAAQNGVIAAESVGIGSCYIGDIMENYEIHKEMFNLPKWVFPVSMLCLGYYPEEMERRITPRFNKEFIIFDEEYKKLSSEDFTEMYKVHESKFNKNNVFGANNIGQLIYARKVGSEFSEEMGRSVREGLKNWTGEEL